MMMEGKIRQIGGGEERERRKKDEKGGGGGEGEREEEEKEGAGDGGGILTYLAILSDNMVVSRSIKLPVKTASTQYKHVYTHTHARTG